MPVNTIDESNFVNQYINDQILLGNLKICKSRKIRLNISQLVDEINIIKINEINNLNQKTSK